VTRATQQQRVDDGSRRVIDRRHLEADQIDDAHVDYFWFGPSSSCSYGLSATSQQYFSPQTSHQQSVSSTFLSEQISTSHQPNEQAACRSIDRWIDRPGCYSSCRQLKTTLRHQVVPDLQRFRKLGIAAWTQINSSHEQKKLFPSCYHACP
jgi:hypothetical protein